MDAPAASQQGRDSKATIRLRLLNDNVQCSELVLRVLQEEGASYDPKVVAATRVLGRGFAGTGKMCGAIAAGMLALALEDETLDSGSKQDKKSILGGDTVRPRNDWLDTFTPNVLEPALFERARQLLDRASARAGVDVNSLNCAEISGVDWTKATPIQMSQYLDPQGGLTHCIDVIDAMVQIVSEMRSDHKH